MASLTVDDELPSKQERKFRKSLLWQYYTRIVPLQAQGKKCQCVLQAPMGTTTTLQNRLKQHPLLMEEYKEDTANMLSMNQHEWQEQPLSQKKRKHALSESDRDGCLGPPTLLHCWESWVQVTHERSGTGLPPAILKKNYCVCLSCTSTMTWEQWCGLTLKGSWRRHQHFCFHKRHVAFACQLELSKSDLPFLDCTIRDEMIHSEYAAYARKSLRHFHFITTSLEQLRTLAMLRS